MEQDEIDEMTYGYRAGIAETECIGLDVEWTAGSVERMSADCLAFARRMPTGAWQCVTPGSLGRSFWLTRAGEMNAFDRSRLDGLADDLIGQALTFGAAAVRRAVGGGFTYNGAAVMRG